MEEDKVHYLRQGGGFQSFSSVEIVSVAVTAPTHVDGGRWFSPASLDALLLSTQQ